MIWIRDNRMARSLEHYRAKFEEHYAPPMNDRNSFNAMTCVEK